MKLHKVLVCLLLLPLGAAAQGSATPSDPNQAAQSPALQIRAGQSDTVHDSLLIGPGDLLHVQVFDTPGMDETARVDDDGSFPLIMGGTIHVIGLTTGDAAREVEASLVDRKYMNHPRVLVTITQFATSSVTVFGQVVRPGTYPIDTPRSIIDVLAIAGGLTDLANRHIIIQRRIGGPPIPYFVSNHAETALADAVRVYPGDRVIIPRAAISYVLGDVSRPGGYPTMSDDSQLTVLQAVAQAGGTLSSAVPSHSKLIRRKPEGGYTVIPLSISDMQKGKKPDMLLEANDIVYIPFSYLRNAFALGIPNIASAATTAAIYAH